MTMTNVLQSEKNVQHDADLAKWTQLQVDIISTMGRNLDAREARLMRLRRGFSDGRTRSLHECADAMELSYTRVHQVSKQCLQKL
jgi:DNA-directed RNA polymerase sigma subunit (sigma70/sigma32)